MKLDAATIERIKTLFPNFAFMFEAGATGFGDDLLDLLVRATLDPDFTTDRFDKEFQQTNYAKETSDAALLFDKKSKAERDERVEKSLADILAQYGDAFETPEAARSVAAQAARFGLAGTRLKSFVYGSAIKVGEPSAVARTNEANKIRQSVREYGYPVTDEEVNAVLSKTPYKGQLYTEDTLLGKAKMAAKGLYGHLAPQIDAGLSLDDIFKNYRAYAQQILELDPNEIDFVNDPKWADAFGNEKTGQLSLSAWQQKLKTDPKYGRRFTNQANQQVSGVVSTLERAFGLVR
jgi:hypothetical protein